MSLIKEIKVKGIIYKKPVIMIMQESGIGVSEYSARTCYDSYEGSESEDIVQLNRNFKHHPRVGFSETEIHRRINKINDIEKSNLLDSLAWVHNHHSILEHTTISYLVKGISRAVLQEHARHRIQSLSVRSTRYTMSSIINAFFACIDTSNTPIFGNFKELLDYDELFITSDEEYNDLQANDIFLKLKFQMNKIGFEEFQEISLAKSTISSEDFKKLRGKEGKYDYFKLFRFLEKSKKKRNVGDYFKHIVNDNWSVDMVITFNIRSLKNYLKLRDSGGAYFQIKYLAEEIKAITPIKYLRLIDKKYAKNY